MATTAGEGTSYEGGGGGAGGKFRKRPFWRPQTTPYDRPQAALRNPRTNGWLSKLVDPASRLISASAHLFFSSVFRKRLPPPPPPPQPPEANQESRERSQEAVLKNPPGVQEPVVNDGGKPTNSFDSSGLSELEQILKKKTFTRSEIDRLTELLHSRTVDLPNGDEDKRAESILPQPTSAFGRRDGFASSPMQEDRIESHLESQRFHGCSSSSVVLEEDVAAPAELAKAYMGSRPSSVSPSMFGLHSQALREDASLNNVPFPPKSPVISFVPKPAVRIGVSENGFMTPRSRGRSAIYNMARTPYSRVHLATAQKGTSSTYDEYGGPSASSSLSQFTWEHYRQYGPKQLPLKRRSSVLEEDIGSVGPIRRLRQKTNPSTSKNLSLPVSGSPFSSHGTGVGPDAARHPIALAQKLPSLDESNHRISRTVRENEDNIMPGTSYTPVPSKSTEMAAKILQQLEKLVPKEKSSEGKVAAGERSPSKLAPNMLRGQALRSLKYVDSSKILQNTKDSHKWKDMCNTSLLESDDTSSQKQDKVEENGLKRFIVSRVASAPAVISNATVSVKEAVPSVKTADSVSTQIFTQSSQKKWAFQMSAIEDFLELDDEILSNEAAPTPLAEGKKKLETSVVESKAVSSEAVTVNKSSAVSEFKALAGSILKKSTDLGTSDGTVVSEKSTGFTFPIAPASGTTFQAVVASPQSTSAFDKIIPSKEPNAPPPLFNSSSKNVDKIPLHTFSSSSSVSESSGLISSYPLEPKPESSNSLANVASGATNLPKNQDSDKCDNKNMQKYGNTMGKSETSISSALSTSKSTSSIFSFGGPANSSSLSNGSLDSSPSIFSSPPALASSNFTTFTNSFTNVATSITATMTANGTPTVTASNSSPSTSAAAPSFPAAPIFKFGSTFVAPSNSVSTASTTSSVETTDLKAKTEKETTFGTSFATASTGNSIFGSSASATSSSANIPSQDPLFGTSSGSMVSTQVSPAGTAVTTVTQNMPIQFGSSASSPIFGPSGITSFTSSSSVFGSSTSSSSLFGSSTPSKVFGSSASFGASSSASSAETPSVSSSGATCCLFASSWQPTKSSIFTSTFNAASQSTGFSFGASSTGASFSSVFSFTSAAATASSSPAQPVFRSSVPVFTAASGNGDQISMEDSMAEDPGQASTPTVPVFGQPSISTPSSGLVFGSTTAPSAVPLHFGSQQNQSAPQTPSPFQTSGSLDFSAGGSLSLGSGGGGDKANRKIVKVKHKSRRR